ncbi:MAG: hypothetical protein AAF570_28125 [Bacteroidota bacterium]
MKNHPAAKRSFGKTVNFLFGLTMFMAFALPAHTQMKSEGPFCGKWINSDASNGGKLKWANLPSARCDEDGAFSNTAQITGYNFTEYLRINNFNFSIPSNANISGIEVVVIRKADTPNSLTDRTVRLTKGGTPTGRNLAAPGLWENSLTAVFYGGETEAWGTSWTPADLNSQSFGVVLDVEFGDTEGSPQVDEVLVTVHFSTPDKRRATSNVDRSVSKYTCRQIGGS